MDDRRDDWRSGVDENLVSLNTAQRVTDREVEDLELKYEGHDKILRGDPEHDTDGLVARLHTQENLVNELRAEYGALKQTIRGYHDGSPGLEGRVDALEGIKKNRERKEGYYWQFITAVAVAIIGLVGIILTNLKEIKAHLPKSKPSPLSQKIEKAKHKKGKPIIKYRVRLSSEDPPSSEEPSFTGHQEPEPSPR